MGAVASTRENLVTAASGEVQEIDVTLPRMIREAEEDGRPDAAASFRLALERERHHRDMFRHALATFDGAVTTPAPSSAGPIVAPSPAAPPRPPPAAAAPRGGARGELGDHAGEEIAELMAALSAGGMARAEAGEVARRIGRHPDILLSALAIFELGLAPQRLGAPVRDALVMAVAFGGASVVPLLPFLLVQGLGALGLSAVLTIAALLCCRGLQARVAGGLRRRRLRAGRSGAAARRHGRGTPVPARGGAGGHGGRSRAAADAAGRRVVGERARAGAGEGVAGDADGIRAGVDPAAG